MGPLARRPGELTIKFMTNAEIRRVNKAYLNHDYATDVIAFPFKTTGRRKADEPFGDIVISVDKAKTQAREMGHGVLKELLTLQVHGILHLRGYDDHRADDRRRMFAHQDRIVAALLP